MLLLQTLSFGSIGTICYRKSIAILFKVDFSKLPQHDVVTLCLVNFSTEKHFGKQFKTMEWYLELWNTVLIVNNVNCCKLHALHLKKLWEKITLSWLYYNRTIQFTREAMYLTCMSKHILTCPTTMIQSFKKISLVPWVHGQNTSFEFLYCNLYNDTVLRILGRVVRKTRALGHKCHMRCLGL